MTIYDKVGVIRKLVIKMSNHMYGNLKASAKEMSNSQSGLVQQGVARRTVAGFPSRTLANRSSEDVHFSRNMPIHAPNMEYQEQQEDYDIAEKDGSEALEDEIQAGLVHYGMGIAPKVRSLTRRMQPWLLLKPQINMLT